MGNSSSSSGAEPPPSITHFSHRHPLQLFNGQTAYICDICGSRGSNTRYRCAACDFDAHLTCINPAQQQPPPPPPPDMAMRSTVPTNQPPMINPSAPNIIHGAYGPPVPPQPAAAAYQGQGVWTQLGYIAAHEGIRGAFGLARDAIHHHQQHQDHVMGMDGGGDGGGGDGDNDGGYSGTSEDGSYGSY